MSTSAIANLEFYRKKNGLTQAQLASGLGLKRYSIADWEQGRSQPSVENLISLSRILGVSIDDLVGFEPIRVIESSDDELLALILRTKQQANSSYCSLACVKRVRSEP